jgi:hypothetical protein
MSPKNKQKPRKIKVNLNALLPRPKPVSWRDAHYYIEHARECPIMGTGCSIHQKTGRRSTISHSAKMESHYMYQGLRIMWIESWQNSTGQPARETSTF